MRLLVVTFALLAVSGAASAQEAPETLRGVYACRAVADDAQRLACFDAAVGRLEAAQQAGEVVAVDRAQAEQVERDSFGFSIPSIAGLLPRFGGGEDRGEALDVVELTVQTALNRGDGQHIFTMTNGQVWAQTEPVSGLRVRAGDTVTVRRGVGGGYLLTPSRGGRAQRVRRVE